MRAFASVCVLFLSPGVFFHHFPSTAVASDAARATPEQAKAMLDNAVALLKSEGKDKAIAAFHDKAGKFVDRDLYVFVLSLEGNTVAHGGNSKLVGKALASMKDADGKPFIQDLIDLAKKEGKGQLTYKWSNPVTKKIEEKKSFVEKVKVGSEELVVGCGAYTGK